MVLISIYFTGGIWWPCSPWRYGCMVTYQVNSVFIWAPSLPDTLRIVYSIWSEGNLSVELWGDFSSLVGIPPCLCRFPWFSYSFWFIMHDQTTCAILVDCCWSHIHAWGLAVALDKILALSFFLVLGKILHVDSIFVPVFSSDNGFIFSWDYGL